jgi:DNA-binding SARP family transcriptional activator/WD40 repeat protein
MVDCLWADGEAPDGAARSVMTYVSRLRAALGEQTIERVHDGYRLVLDGDALDATEFEACLSEAESAEPERAIELYERGLSLWRGDAYGELGHEWWVLAEANRLNELRLAGMEDRAEVAIMLDQHHRAIPQLTWIRSTHPLRERTVSLLMQALFASGRQADALREFHAYRAQLAEETGLEPSAELQVLEKSIAIGRPAALPAGRFRPLRGYTIHAVIGEGAFGRVLAATQPGTNREVAIKVIRPDLADDPTFVQRFEAEAQLVARLEHPHIVPLYDYWREPGGAYLVFRLLTGGTAQAALVSNGAFDVARVSRIVEEIGSALMAAHTAGVVHCDVKPSNVLFDAAGNAYLSDFGIALTASVGQPDARSRGYDVPELVEPAGDTVRSDIFSFGCMLWQLLAGESPQIATDERWQPPRASTLEPRRGRRVPSLVDRIDQPSAAIDAVIARATEPDPAQRYESMAELIIAWRAAVGREQGVVTPVDQPAGSFTSSARRRAASTLAAAWSVSVNPFKGLRAFMEADAEDFFGRDGVVVALRDALAIRRFVAIVGPSGSGKSSVVQAGLLRLLREGGDRVAVMVPGERPGEALRMALRSIATSAASAAADEVELLEGVAAEGATDLVLVVDQIEECWTLADGADRERFLSALAQAVTRNIRCVVTVRADLYDRPLQHQLVGPLLVDGTFPLPPLDAEALEEAVVRPARRNGVDFDDGVATAIVAEASAHSAGLPLLQFALAELYERRVDGRITAEALHELGGIGGAVGRRAEETYQALDASLQPHARELFGRLVAPGLGAPDTRRRARSSELSRPAQDVAARFVQARLLVADRDLATREPVVEVAHEALLSNWPRLREWLNADRNWIAQLQHLAAASRGWKESGQADEELYRGSRLEAVLEALPERAGELNEEERAFVESSRESRDAERDRERRRNRHLRRLLAAAVCLLIVAIVAGLLAYNRQQAAAGSRRGAEITTLTSRALAMQTSNRDAAALLAVEANRLRSDNESRSALFATFTHDPGFLGYHTFDGVRVDGALVPGTNMAVVSVSFNSPVEPATQLQLLDLDSGELSSPFDPFGQSSGDVYVEPLVSADGRVAVAVGHRLRGSFWQGPEIAAFDVASGKATGTTIRILERWNYNFSVNRDGSQLAVGGRGDGAVWIYDLRSGKRLATIAAPADTVLPDRHLGAPTSVAAWAPHGQLFVGSSGSHLREFDPVTFELVRDISVPTNATSNLLQFSPDGAFVVAGGMLAQEAPDVFIRVGQDFQSKVTRVDLTRGVVEWTFDPDDYLGCETLAFSVTDDTLWCSDGAGSIHARSLTTGDPAETTVEHQRANLSGLEYQSVGGRGHLVSFGSQSATIGRWRVDGTGPITRSVAQGQDYVEYSPDGRWLLVKARLDEPGRSSISVWDSANDRAVLTLPSDLADATWLDDSHLGAVEADGHGSIVDVPTGLSHDVAIDVVPNWTIIRRVADGQIAFGYWSGRVDVWDFDDALETVRFKKSTPEIGFPALPVDRIAASDDFSRIYVSGYGIFSFDTTDGRRLHWLQDMSITSVTVASDGLVVAGHIDGTISLHDPDDLRLLATIPGVPAFVDSLFSSSDGRFVLAQAGDTIALYDVERRQRIGDAISIHGVNVADIRPDGLEIAVATLDKPGVTLWTLDPSALSDAACRVAGRNLRPAEWDAYIGDLAPYHAICSEYSLPQE